MMNKISDIKFPITIVLVKRSFHAFIIQTDPRADSIVLRTLPST